MSPTSCFSWLERVTEEVMEDPAGETAKTVVTKSTGSNLSFIVQKPRTESQTRRGQHNANCMILNMDFYNPNFVLLENCRQENPSY